MPIMTWNDSLSVGVDAMDMQHKKLVNLVNQLFDSMKEGKGKQVLGGILSELVSYTNTHFTAEEKLMQEHGYPEVDSHKALHRDLLAKVGGFCDKFKAGDLGISISLCDFLQEWLKVHISGQDRQYAKHVNCQAVAAK